MAHLVNIVQLNEQGEHVRVKYTHKFVFEATARKWADGFNRIYSDPVDDEDRVLAVYAGEQTEDAE